MTEKKRWTVTSFITAFVKNTLGKKTREGNFFTEHHEDGSESLKAQCFGQKMDTLAVRIRGGIVLGNAARFHGVGGRMAWGNFHQSWQGETSYHRTIRNAGAVMIPFNVIEQLGLTPNQVQVIVRGPEEKLRRKQGEVEGYRVQNRASDTSTTRILSGSYDEGKVSIEVISDKSIAHYERLTNLEGADYPKWSCAIETHFVGAILFRCGEKDMLFDVDREELKHDIFNPFVVALPRKCESIEDAYASLMPEQVKQAIAEGKDVKRQGEWYFIPKDYKPREDRPTPEGIVLTQPPMPSKELVIACAKSNLSVIPGQEIRNHWRAESDDQPIFEAYNKQVEDWQFSINQQFNVLSDNEAKAGQLRQGNSRPNTVEKFVKAGEEVFVMGKVAHSGREHRDLMLNEWHVAIPNAAVSSWQVSGDVD